MKRSNFFQNQGYGNCFIRIIGTGRYTLDEMNSDDEVIKSKPFTHTDLMLLCLYWDLSVYLLYSSLSTFLYLINFRKFSTKIFI